MSTKPTAADKKAADDAAKTEAAKAAEEAAKKKEAEDAAKAKAAEEAAAAEQEDAEDESSESLTDREKEQAIIALQLLHKKLRREGWVRMSPPIGGAYFRKGDSYKTMTGEDCSGPEE